MEKMRPRRLRPISPPELRNEVGLKRNSNSFLRLVLMPDTGAMASQSIEDWVSYLMEPSLVAILIAVLLVLSIPLSLHLLIYRSSNSTQLPSFLLIGPSGAGKTALMTLVRVTPTPGYRMLDVLTVTSSNEATMPKREPLKHPRS